jgi:hypothetical protein
MTQDRPPKSVKYLMPDTRLAALVGRPGGRSREMAIAQADQQVELLREDYAKIVDELIGQLETDAARRDRPPAESLATLQRSADRIITLGGSFNMLFLVEAAKRLCDLTETFARLGIVDQGSVAVHVHAIRLFGPLSPAIPPEAAADLLAELHKVYQHFSEQ